MTWQPIAIEYPDIEKVLCGEFAPDGTVVYAGKLHTALAGRPEACAQDVYVSNSVPSSRRDRMVIVRRDGGNEGEMRDRARVSLQIWATKAQEATDLARLVAALCKTFQDGDPIVSVVPLSGPTAIDDPSGQPLRYITAEFHTRGEVVTS
jgi:hypothetical protein